MNFEANSCGRYLITKQPLRMKHYCLRLHLFVFTDSLTTILQRRLASPTAKRKVETMHPRGPLIIHPASSYFLSELI